MLTAAANRLPGNLQIVANAAYALLLDLLTNGTAPTKLNEAGPLDGLFFYDETLVRMTLENALQNALRHARSEVLLDVHADEQWLDFTVEDDGEGYPADLLAGAGQPAALSGQGTGLGLHLARLVAGLHAHAGKEARVELANREQGGTRFSLRLPR